MSYHTYEELTLRYSRVSIMKFWSYHTYEKLATASLDVDNESVIQESISKLIRNKTVLIIAHRMRTVDGVDQIIVLKDGVVAEQGTPSVLKEKNGIYKHMVDVQLESEQWKYNQI